MQLSLGICSFQILDEFKVDCHQFFSHVVNLSENLDQLLALFMLLMTL
jgi:hypothetical protein